MPKIDVKEIKSQTKMLKAAEKAERVFKNP